MKRRPKEYSHFVRIVILAAGCLLAFGCSAAGVRTLALDDVIVVDVVRGSLNPNQTVLVAGNRIVAAGPVSHVNMPYGVEVIEASGRYLIPGLIDMHVHTLWDASVPSTFLPLFVANGVTTVRDMGGTLELLREHRKSPAIRGLPSPRVIAAGAILDGPEPVHPGVSLPVSSAEEALAAVAAVTAAGADFVKIYTLLPRDAFEAVVAAAGERGLPVSGHVPHAVGPVGAAAAGMRTIEHLVSETGGFCAASEPSSCELPVEAFRRHGTWHVPTLVMQGQTEASDLCGDPRLRFLVPAVLEYWFKGELTPPACDTASPATALFEPELPVEARLVRILHEGDVPLLAGTDEGVPYALPGWSLDDELQLLVNAGLSPSEALRAATWEAARALGRDDELGTIRPGYLADLVLLSANPLQDIRNTRRIEAMILNGRWFSRDNLDTVFADVAGSVEEQLRSRGITRQ